MSGFAARLRHAYSRFGLVGLVRQVWARVLHARSSWAAGRDDRAFDKAFGVETAGIVRLTSLEVEGPHRDAGVRYQASSPAAVREVLGSLDVPRRDYAFVDYGCGKGRMLVIAADLGFRTVIGVEFAPALCEVARANVERVKFRFPDTAFVVGQGDATDYDPPSGPTVLYFYNPFGPEVMAKVLHRVRASFLAGPRPLFLVFTGLVPALAENADFLRPVSEHAAGKVFEARLPTEG